MYKIAGVIVRLEGLNSSYISHRMKNYKIEAGDNVSADLNIHFKENNCIVVPAGRDFRRLDAWYWIDRGSEGYSAVKQYSKYRATLIRADIDRQCKNAVIEYVDIKDHLDVTTDYLLHFVLGDIFAFCQTEHHAAVLHSAAVAYQGQAVLFSAPSETGKSTHAGLWKQFYGDDVTLFNDDTPVVRECDGSLFACGSPWSGKTEINENREYPLKGIVFLKQAQTNTIRKLSTVEAAVRLLNETRKPVFEALMDKHVEVLNNIITKTPVYELGCTISREAVDLVKDTLFQE